jgi:hypothetical protein
MGVNGRGPRGWRPLQNGIKQPLFCEECEQHFNENFEKPFKRQWIDTPALPARWPESEPVWINVDYRSFKLLHLSVLFRASVATLPTFRCVALGVHQELVRQQILNRDPGPVTRYPIMGLALFDKLTRELNHTVVMPVAARFEDLRCYSMAYGGVNWWIGVSGHVNAQWMSSCVSEDGRIPMVGLPWNELGVVRQAGRMLSKRD